MLNHAFMLAECGSEVTLVGYSGSPVDMAVASHARISIRSFVPPDRAPEGASRWLFLVLSAARVFTVSLKLTRQLLRTPRGGVILVQNPPSIPTLFAAWIAARLRGCRFVIDWHNFGYSMLALRLGPAHPAVRLSAAYEQMFRRWADGHLCVSRAMAAGMPGAVVVYDRPRVIAEPLSRAERQSLAAEVLGTALAPGCALLVSPTSWTADEPMEPLIEALDAWERCESQTTLLIVISGRGPLRQKFEDRVASKRWQRAAVRTVFLDPEGYREILRSAEMGLCFHLSSSGVDLPMKVMDLFGAGSPVCAYNYGPCIEEQIEPGSNGLLFGNGTELAAHLVSLFGGYAAGETGVLDRMRGNVRQSCRETWADVWKRDAGPLFGFASQRKAP
jgi:beta-1,4-mannosyltransferase